MQDQLLKYRQSKHYLHATELLKNTGAHSVCVCVCVCVCTCIHIHVHVCVYMTLVMDDTGNSNIDMIPIFSGSVSTESNTK